MILSGLAGRPKWDEPTQQWEPWKAPSVNLDGSVRGVGADDAWCERVWVPFRATVAVEAVGEPKGCGEWLVAGLRENIIRVGDVQQLECQRAVEARRVLPIDFSGRLVDDGRGIVDDRIECTIGRSRGDDHRVLLACSAVRMGES